MVDALEEARFLWKLFDLNKSDGAGMEAWNGDELVKRFGGVVANPSDFRVCVSPNLYGSNPDDGRSKPAKSSRRNRRTG